MGGMLIREIAQADDLYLVAATDQVDSLHIGKDTGELSGSGSNGVLLGVDPESLFSEADVVIDFSAPDASVHLSLIHISEPTDMRRSRMPSSA